MDQRATNQLRENNQDVPKDQKTDGQADLGESNPSVRARLHKSEMRSKQRSSGEPPSYATSQQSKTYQKVC